MPKLQDVKKILLIGSGPVLIGQGTEFDDAGYQVSCLLKEEGYEVAVLNNNPVSLINDPKLVDRVYLLPLTAVNLEQIIAKERPDLILAGYGGQMALNLIMQLSQITQTNKLNIDINPDTIVNSGNRYQFRMLMKEAALNVADGECAGDIASGMEIGLKIGFPIVVRPYYTIGGAGSRLVYNQEELNEALEYALEISLEKQVVLEKSIAGWEEYELDVVRDANGQSIFLSVTEYLDPVGVHPGDSIAVIPAQNLNQNDYHELFVLAGKALAAVGVIGLASLRFARNPISRQWIIIGINVGFNRNANLTSKTWGISLAVLNLKIALGYYLEEIFNDIKLSDKQLMFGSNVNHVGVKMPRFNFEKFPETEKILNTSMKSSGEALTFGDCFQVALQKTIRAVNVSQTGWGDSEAADQIGLSVIKEKISNPNPERLFYLRLALKHGMTIDEINGLSKMPLWFLKELADLCGIEKELTTYALYNIPAEVLRKAKERGFSDCQLASILRVAEEDVRAKREECNIIPRRKQVSCQHQQALLNRNPYCYLTHTVSTGEVESAVSKKIIIVGSGPNRIGGCSEYEYGIVHATQAIKEASFQPIIINPNSTGVSTGINTGDKIYFEPLDIEEILNVIQIEKPNGVILQFAGDKVYSLTKALGKYGIKVLGTSLEDLADIYEDAKLNQLLLRLGINYPLNITVNNHLAAIEGINQIGFPAIISPVKEGIFLTRIIYTQDKLNSYLEQVNIMGAYPVKIEKLIADAVGVAVDCIGDGKEAVIAGIMEQIEEASIHFGDSAVSIPPYSVADEVIGKIKEITLKLARSLAIKGFLHIRFAVKHDTIYILNLIPTASLSIPLVSKVTETDWAKVATQAMLGISLEEQNILFEQSLKRTAVKEAVFSFNRFPGTDTVLGPEMRSTGMVLGVDSGFGMAFIKSQLAAGENIPTSGTVFLSIRNEDKRSFIAIAKQLIDLGFKLVAPDETATILKRNEIPCETVFRPGEGRPNILDKIKNREIQWVINTPSEAQPRNDESLIRRTAAIRGIPVITTLSGALAAVQGLNQYLRNGVIIETLK